MTLSLDRRVTVVVGTRGADGNIASNSANYINLGTFDKWSGGDVDSEDTRYRAGGRATEEVLGGTRTATDIVVSRLFRLAVDFANLNTLFDHVGKLDADITVGYMKAGNDVAFDGVGTNIHGNTIYKGKLKTVKQPEHDSMSSDVALIELTFTVSPPVAATV